LELKHSRHNLKRLAFHTLSETQAKRSVHFSLSHSTSEEIDCVVTVDSQDINKAKAALDCYKTYQETIKKSGIKDLLDSEVCFEFFGENFSPPLNDLFANLEKAKL
jgi:hypothetical protein